jgi:hypothetical protein
VLSRYSEKSGMKGGGSLSLVGPFSIYLIMDSLQSSVFYFKALSRVVYDIHWYKTCLTSSSLLLSYE